MYDRQIEDIAWLNNVIRIIRFGSTALQCSRCRLRLWPSAAGLRAVSKDKPIDPTSVQRYLESKFGAALEDAYEAMQQLAISRPPTTLADEAYQPMNNVGQLFPLAPRVGVQPAH